MEKKSFSLKDLDVLYNVAKNDNTLLKDVYQGLIKALKAGSMLPLKQAIEIVRKRRQGEWLSVAKIIKELIIPMEHICCIPSFRIHGEKCSDGGNIKIVSPEFFLTLDPASWIAAEEEEQTQKEQLEKKLQDVKIKNNHILFYYLLELCKDNIFFITKHFLNYCLYRKNLFAWEEDSFNGEELFHLFAIEEYRNITDFLEKCTAETISLKAKELKIILRERHIYFDYKGKSMPEKIPAASLVDQTSVSYVPRETGEKISVIGFPSIKSKDISLSRVSDYLTGTYLTYFLDNVYNNRDRKDNDELFCLNLFKNLSKGDSIFFYLQRTLYTSLFESEDQERNKDNEELLRGLYKGAEPGESDALKNFFHKEIIPLEEYTKFAKLIELLHNKAGKNRFQVELFGGLFQLLKANGFFTTEKYIPGNKAEDIAKEMDKYLRQRLYIHFYRDVVSDLIGITREDQGIIQSLYHKSFSLKHASFQFYLKRPADQRYKNFKSLARKIDIHDLEIAETGESGEDLVIIPYPNIREIFLYLLRERYSNEWRILLKLLFYLRPQINIIEKRLTLEHLSFVVKLAGKGELDITVNGRNPNIHDLEELKRYLPASFRSFEHLKLAKRILDKTAFGFVDEKEYMQMNHFLMRKQDLLNKLLKMKRKEAVCKNKLQRFFLSLLHAGQKLGLEKKMEQISSECDKKFTSSRKKPSTSAGGQEVMIRSDYNAKELAVIRFLYQQLVEKRDKKYTARLNLLKKVAQEAEFSWKNIFVINIEDNNGKYIMDHLDKVSGKTINTLVKEGLLEVHEKNIRIADTNAAGKIYRRIKEEVIS